jgi:hypothetical protein
MHSLPDWGRSPYALEQDRCDIGLHKLWTEVESQIGAAPVTTSARPSTRPLVWASVKSPKRRPSKAKKATRAGACRNSQSTPHIVPCDHVYSKEFRLLMEGNLKPFARSLLVTWRGTTSGP